MNSAYPTIMATCTKDCPICCEKYNRTQHSAVICEQGECGFTACKQCIRQYLLSTISEPNCMQCKKTLSEQFLIHNLNRSFVSGDYKRHRVSVLLDKAMSQMPETMPDAMRMQELDETNNEIKHIRDEMNKLNDEMNKLKKQLNDLQIKSYRLKHPETKAAEETRKFVMACPREDCRGFLSTAYKCGLCEYYTCSACLKPKTSTEEPHVCNPDDVSTTALIKSQTKPCPTCGERISKIAGCDQMWCTSCHNAFSWRTGQVDNGIVHNPHFFQYQRSMHAEGGGNVIQRGLGQCNTDQLPDYVVVMQTAKRLQRTKNKDAISVSNCLTYMYEIMAHINHHETPNLQRKLTYLEDSTPLRISYILGKTEKTQLSENLYANEKKRRYTVLIYNVMRLLNQVGLETLWGIVNTPEDNLSQFISLILTETTKFKELCVYCNIEWLSISIDFRISVPWIVIKADRSPSQHNIAIRNYPIHNEFRKIYKHVEDYTPENYSAFVSLQLPDEFVSMQLPGA